MIKEGLLVATASTSDVRGLSTPPPGKGHTSSALSVEEDDLRSRLETMGTHIGANLTERYVSY